MSRQIKVTGYIDSDDLAPTDRDLTHEMGVSNDFFERTSTGQVGVFLSEIEFALVGEPEEADETPAPEVLPPLPSMSDSEDEGV